jgi:glyoxylase-like metal-dependent hydrolase (beta-lactamase superfamily II)
MVSNDPKDWFEVYDKIHDRIIAIREPNHEQNVVSYLVLGKSRAVLIDTGMGYSDISEVVSKHTKLPVTVLLTHSHWDHIGGNNLFDDLWLFNDYFEIGRLKRGYDTHNQEDIDEIFYGLKSFEDYKNGFEPHQYTVPGRKKFNVINPGEMLKIDNLSFQVYHTPGHSPGSVCFLVPELHALFTGDTLYPGPLYAMLPESNQESFFNSIERLAVLGKLDDLQLFPGHNSPLNDVGFLRYAVNYIEDVKNGKIPNTPYQENKLIGLQYAKADKHKLSVIVKTAVE